jgi:ABC-type maltose transport system permease subunit
MHRTINILRFIHLIIFIILVASIAFPIILTILSNKQIKSIYGKLESDSKKFLDTYSKYLTEEAEKQNWL